MMIFIQKSIVLFATPKTGSTSFHNALAAKAEICFAKTGFYKHISPRRFDQTFKSFIETISPAPLTKIAVVREPIEWLHSWYRYRSRDSALGSQASTSDISFDQFVEAYLGDNRPAFANIASQSKFLTTESSELAVDQLWSFTALNDLALFLSLQIGHEFTLPSANVSPKLTFELSPENHKALESHFKLDYALYRGAIGND